MNAVTGDFTGGAPAAGCFLCATDEGAPLFSEGIFTARRCGCGLVYIDPPADTVAVDPTADHHHRSYYARPAARRLSWLQEFVKSGRVLDVGCGEGEFAAAARAAGYDVDGVDPSEQRAAIAEARVGIKVERALVEEARLAPGAYDAVVHVDMLSHFPDPVAALTAMRAALKPGGVMCFEVALFGGLSPRWWRWAGRGNLPVHRWFYDEKALEALLARAGFRIVGTRLYAIAASTIITSLGLRLFRRDALAGKVSHEPMVRGRMSGFYYNFQTWLRYGLGRWLPVGGPQVAFVAAVPISPAAPTA